jgi:hypothetical protein
MPKALKPFIDDFGDLMQPGDEVVAAPERARVLQRLGVVDDTSPGRPRWAAAAPEPEPLPLPSVAVASSVGQGAALTLRVTPPRPAPRHRRCVPDVTLAKSVSDQDQAEA